MAGDGAVYAEHEDVVAQDLEVVARVIARGEAFVVEHGLASVGGHLQVATKAGGCPRGVARVAGHGGIGMGETGVVPGHLLRVCDGAVFGD